ncbi:MAG: DUF2867 domain-containing protein, partial [Planctomycetes bacterium]|nr:DUF2867 domain-containing protein [Planctomycetota bacterium]
MRKTPIRPLATPNSGELLIIEGDAGSTNFSSLIPKTIDVAYYLIHSMSSPQKDLAGIESQVARHCALQFKAMELGQIVYLGGIVPEGELSSHMKSRYMVEGELRSSGRPLTVIRAAIIIGSGSASFEIMRDLVEKLPVMIAPKWLHSRCQPIAVYDCIHYLVECAGNSELLDRTVEIGGPDVLTYREMLLELARVRGLKRLIVTVPVLTPRLSSFWLTLVTAVPFSLSQSLVMSLVHDAVTQKTSQNDVLAYEPLRYEEALKRAFAKIQGNDVFSKWTDASHGQGDFLLN